MIARQLGPVRSSVTFLRRRLVLPGRREPDGVIREGSAAYLIEDDTTRTPINHGIRPVITAAMQAIQALSASFHNKGVPEETLELVDLRASQINGCSSCVQAGAAGARRRATRPASHGSRLAGAPYFTDAERAALALAEAVTRLADRPDPVPAESGTRPPGTTTRKLAPLLLSIATTNVFNRLNAPTRQIAGAWGDSGEHYEVLPSCWAHRNPR